jgi:hypothetical protein
VCCWTLTRPVSLPIYIYKFLFLHKHFSLKKTLLTYFEGPAPLRVPSNSGGPPSGAATVPAAPTSRPTQTTTRIAVREYYTKHARILLYAQYRRSVQSSSKFVLKKKTPPQTIPPLWQRIEVPKCSQPYMLFNGEKGRDILSVLFGNSRRTAPLPFAPKNFLKTLT